MKHAEKNYYLNDVADVGNLADLREHLLRARSVEVEAAHRHTAGADAAEGKRRDVDLQQTEKKSRDIEPHHIVAHHIVEHGITWHRMVSHGIA